MPATEIMINADYRPAKRREPGSAELKGVLLTSRSSDCTPGTHHETVFFTRYPGVSRARLLRYAQKNNPGDLRPAAIFFAGLDLGQKTSFQDGHELYGKPDLIRISCDLQTDFHPSVPLVAIPSPWRGRLYIKQQSLLPKLTKIPTLPCQRND